MNVLRSILPGQPPATLSGTWHCPASMLTRVAIQLGAGEQTATIVGRSFTNPVVYDVLLDNGSTLIGLPEEAFRILSEPSTGELAAVLSLTELRER